MTRYLIFGGFLALAACTDGVDTDTDDTDDTDTDTDTDTTDPGPLELVDFTGDCADDMCIYTVTTNKEVDLVEVDMTETDDSFLYTEYHDGFEMVWTNDDGTVTYELVLMAVTSVDDVEQNETTLFYADSVLDGTTWYFGTEIFGETEADDEFDCIVTGHDTSYYTDAEWCDNVGR